MFHISDVLMGSQHRNPWQYILVTCLHIEAYIFAVGRGYYMWGEMVKEWGR